MKLNASKYIKKNKRNTKKNNKRILENANFLNNGKTLAEREELNALREWHRKVRENIRQWRESQNNVI